MAATCIFCKIIKGDIPALKLWESPKTLAFMDIQPLSMGHSLVIPKHHGTKITDIPDDQLSEVLAVIKKLASASGATDYNILQNNGRLAHQLVEHVHFHFIPKPSEAEGLGIRWPMKDKDEVRDAVGREFERMKAQLAGGEGGAGAAGEGDGSKM